MEVEIRPVRVDEEEQLLAIARETFIAAFAHLNDPEDFGQYVAEKFSREQIQKELAHPESEFFFLQKGAEVLGYLKVNWGKAQSEDKLPKALEIERIYLLKDWKGKGLGKLLLEKAYQVAQEKQMKCIWLGVWEHNKAALHFYKREGFVLFDQHIFVLGQDRQIDWMLKKEID
ncbi:MAG: GNAT family N-acetyltransferase [Bacteroidota bacterium]